MKQLKIIELFKDNVEIFVHDIGFSKSSIGQSFLNNSQIHWTTPKSKGLVLPTVLLEQMKSSNLMRTRFICQCLIKHLYPDCKKTSYSSVMSLLNVIKTSGWTYMDIFSVGVFLLVQKQDTETFSSRKQFIIMPYGLIVDLYPKAENHGVQWSCFSHSFSCFILQNW